MAAKLYGFWSYSREGTGGISALHREMQDSLSGNGPAPGGAEIYLDTIGNDPGVNWSESLVAAASRSALFFWVQNPRWPIRPVCRFEFAMFEDRVSRIAREFSTHTNRIDEDRLWHSLVVPIHWARIPDDRWDMVEPDEAAHLRRRCAQAHVLDNLDFAKRDDEAKDTEIGYGPLCRLVTARITAKLTSAIPTANGGITRLLEYLESDQQAFTEEWITKFKELDILGMERRGDTRSPRAVVSASMAWQQRQLDWPNLRQVKIPATGGIPAFWITKEPIPEKVIEGLDTTLLEPITDRAGNTRWPAATAAWFARELNAAHLALPTPAQSRALFDLQVAGGVVADQLGMLSRIFNFWHSSDPGYPPTPARPTAETHLPLVLVSIDE